MNLQKLVKLDSEATATLALVRGITDRITEARQQRAFWQNRIRDLGEPDGKWQLKDGAYIQVPTTPSAAKKQALDAIADMDRAIKGLETELARAEEAWRPLSHLRRECLEYLKTHGIPAPVEIDPGAPRGPSVPAARFMAAGGAGAVPSAGMPPATASGAGGGETKPTATAMLGMRPRAITMAGRH